MDNPNFDPYAVPPNQHQNYQIGSNCEPMSNPPAQNYQIGSNCEPQSYQVPPAEPEVVYEPPPVVREISEPPNQVKIGDVLFGACIDKLCDSIIRCLGTCCCMGLIFVFFVFIAISGNSHSLNPCPSGYTYYISNDDSQCYRAFLLRETFDEAFRTCAAANATIATMGSKQENDRVVDFLKSTLHRNGFPLQYPNGMHIGLVFTNQKWSWLDRSQSNFSNWAPGFPRDGLNNRFARVVLRPNSSTNQWVNGNGIEKHYFVCKTIL